MLRRLLLDLVYGVVVIVAAPFWMRKARGDWRERFGHPASDALQILARQTGVGT